jgi:glycerol-3-phosphate acyltransferase PlsY
MDVAAVLVVVAGYLLGSIDFGVIVPRLRGVDIYSVGSGNPGASNVLRTMGRSAAAFVMLGDAAKGFGAAALGDLVAGEATGVAAGFAAVVGHCWPLWHRFHGGKGVATGGGATFWIEPLMAGALLGGWGLVAGVTRRASIASIVLVSVYVPGMALFGHRGWSLVWGGAIALLILVRHHANIRRLVSGAEYTIEEAK